MRVSEVRTGWVEQQAEDSHGWLAAHLRAWERHRVVFGVASRTIPDGMAPCNLGHDGSVREAKGRTPGAMHGLTEHARVFRAGCIEGGPNGLPPPAVLRSYAEQVPQGFTFTVMLSDDALVYRFPYGHPDRDRRGEINPGFLDPGPLQERVCAVLDALDGALETVVLQLQPVYRTEELGAPEFVGRLDRFLGGLPRACRYAVDLRAPAFNVPGYRACLRDHGVAHVLHHAPLFAPVPAPRTVPYALPQPPDPPSLIDQLLIPGLLSAPFCVARVHASPGWSRDDENEDLTLGIRELVRTCGDDGVALTVLIEGNQAGSDADRGDGNRNGRRHGDGNPEGRDPDVRGGLPAVTLLTGLLHSLDGELARRSPLRRRAA